MTWPAKAVSSPISEPLTSDPSHRPVSATTIINSVRNAVIIAEVELS